MRPRKIAYEPLLNVLVVTIALGACASSLLAGRAATAVAARRPAAHHRPNALFVESYLSENVRVRAAIDRAFGDRAPIARCIAAAESSWRIDARAGNEDSSVDRGLFQINSRWHPSVSDDEAFDLHANVSYAHALSRGGTDWSQWAELTRIRCGVET